ncbi:hypothetical protein [Streptomyces sp. BE230]|uniref:hypothetical protein n=1 Tax=Streptomyces sp. BE230 TaxID=3002526 RepID=UPI002ED64D93|nr:hypothetical protein [Streptomyces sp. BE230]
MAIDDIDPTHLDRDDLGRLADMLPGLKWGSPVGSEAHSQAAQLIARVIAAQEACERHG